MSEKIVQLNEEIIKGQIKELVRGSVEETLNELLEKEAVSPPGEQCGGGSHRDVLGGRLRAPGRGHHGGTVGQ